MKIELEDSFVTSCQIARGGDYDYRLCRLIFILAQIFSIAGVLPYKSVAT